MKKEGSRKCWRRNGSYEAAAEEIVDADISKTVKIRYSKRAEKIAFMVQRFEEDGFTSYWL